MADEQLMPGSDPTLDVPALDRDDDAWFAGLRAADPSLRPGSIGPYELLCEIGRGGQGVVYQARQPGTGRVIAVKRVCAGGAGSASFRMRFEREIRTTAALNHPNIVTIFGCDTVDDQALLLMELIDGPPVDRWVESLGPPGEPGRTAAVVTLFERLCRAVAHAHQHGVIHRDLKPSNVLVVSVGAVSDRDSSASRPETAPTAQPKVLDFGLARLLSPYVTDSLFQTHTTGFVGTPAYASPEHFADDGAAVDVRSDIYAVGVMLYQALTGRLPYDGASSFSALMKAIQERDPPRPSSLTPQIVRELELIVLKALAKEKSQRYQSMDAFAEDLRRHLAGETVLAHPPTAAYQFKKLFRRHKLAFSFSLVILLLVAAFAVTATVLGLRERAARTGSDWNAYIAGLAAASAALRSDDAASAQRQLERTPAWLRGWEWSYFSRQSDGSLTSVRDGRNVVAVDHQGEPIAAVAQDQVWRSDDTDRPCRAILHRDAWPGTDLSSGLTLALVVIKENAGEPDLGRRLLDLRSGRILADGRQWEGGRFSPDGRTLAIMENHNHLRLIPIEGDIQTAATQPPVLQTDTLIHTVAFSPDSRLVACSASDGTVQILDVATRRLLPSISTGERTVWGVAFSPDGMRLATGSWDKKVALWDLASQQRLWTAEGHRERVSALAFSSDGSRLASASWDKTIGVWDASTGRPIARLIGHAAEPESLAFTDGNDRLASYDQGGTLKTWRILDRAPAIAQGEFRRIDFLALPGGDTAPGRHGDSPAASWMAVSESTDESWHNPRVSLIDLSRRRKIGVLWTDDQQELGFVDGRWLASAASPDGRWMAVGSSDGHVLLWRGDDLSKLVSAGSDSMPSPPPYHILTIGDPEHRGRLNYPVPTVMGAVDSRAPWATSLSIGANGRLGLSRYDGGLEVWDIERRVKLLDHPSADGRAGACILSPDGHRLAWADRDGGLHVWSVATGRILAERASKREAQIIPRFAFSHDGSLLIPLMHGPDVVLYRTVDLSVVHRLRSHSSSVSGVAFSPDGTRLVSAANDNTLKIWDVATGRELATLHGHQYMVNCVTFSPDGKTLISGGQDNTVRFWDAAPLASP